MNSKIETYKDSFDQLVVEDQVSAQAISKMRDAVHQIEPLVDEIVTMAEKEKIDGMEKTDQMIRSMNALAIGVGAFAAFLGLIMSVLIIRSILKQLGADPSEVLRIANEVAVGND